MACVQSVRHHTCRENIVLSFRPSLHSGIPDKYAFICSVPLSSEWTITPLLLTIKLNCSMQSRKTCKQELHVALRQHQVANRPPQTGGITHLIPLIEDAFFAPCSTNSCYLWGEFSGVLDFC